MEKKIRYSNFKAIHNAFNKVIVGEVKRFLNLVEGKRIDGDGSSLCKLIVSDADYFEPVTLSVKKVWLDKGKLNFEGHVELGNYDASYTEDCDLLDITDFEYLITSNADKVLSNHKLKYNSLDLYNVDDGDRLDRAVWSVSSVTYNEVEP